MNRLDDNIREKYPKLAEVYDKQEGNKTLKEKHKDVVAKMTPVRMRVETYEEEVSRGIMHTPAWDQKMTQDKKRLEELEKQCVAALDAWCATLPPYDPDNHINSCGCVTVNGKRVHWCGDHY